MLSRAAGVPVAVHAITDGRDVAPKSAYGYFARSKTTCPRARASSPSRGAISPWTATPAGTGWPAFAAMVHGRGATCRRRPRRRGGGYDHGRDRRVHLAHGAGRYAACATATGFCLNFRADRAREILSALADPSSTRFDRGAGPALALSGDGGVFRPPRAYMTTVFPARTSSTRWAPGWLRMACGSSAWPRPRNTPMSPSS
jgi:2,3-bisphosphoglycerate-independent phosphoglycerate mutase